MIATLLAGFGWLALRVISNRSGRPKPPQQYVEQPSAAEHAREPSAVEQPSGAAATNDPIRRSNPGDEEHKRHERAHWRIANLAGVATASAAAVAAVFAGGAYSAANEQAGIARNALAVSDRPWIKVERVSVGRFQIVNSDGGIFVSGLAHVTVKNFGRSPAINLFINSELKPLGGDQDGLHITTAICASALKGRSGFALQAVFPGDGPSSGEEEVPVQLFVPGEDIVQARRAQLDSNFELDKSTSGAQEADRHRREAEAEPLTAAFTFAGCVTYFSYSGLIGQTGFLFDIYRHGTFPVGNIPNSRSGFDVSRTDDVPPKDINVVPATLGGIYVR